MCKWAAVVASLMALYGCDLAGPDEPGAIQRDLTRAESRIVEADSRFGRNLFRAVNEADPDQNIFISPLSVSMALGMTLNGADGATYEEMKQALELQGLSEEEINASYRSLIDLLEELDPSVVFEIANSIWYRDGFEVEPDFLDVNESNFEADVQALDFDEPGAVRTINDWVDDRTHGKIAEIIDEIGRDVVMYLINAIYFNGRWTYEFDEDATRELPFTNADGTETVVPMMSMSQDLPYLATDRFQAVDLPYGDRLYSMTVVLPNEEHDVRSLAQDLDPADWEGRFDTDEVHLRLPRFSFAYEIEMKDVLSALGMERAFHPRRADFTRINPVEELYVSNVKHKAFIEVDELGTEAAAVTSVEVRVTSVSGVSMHVDRPFLFVIRERHSGTILFVGKVMSL